MDQVDTLLQDASEFADVKMRIQVFPVVNTRRTMNEVEVKDYVFIIGPLNGEAPAAATGVIVAPNLQEAVLQAILKLAETQGEITEAVRERMKREEASQKLITPSFGRR